MRLYLFGARNQSRRLHHENIVAASGVAVESTASIEMIWDLGYVALWHDGYNLGYKNINLIHI